MQSIRDFCRLQMIGIVAVTIRLRLEARSLDMWKLIPIMICIVGRNGWTVIGCGAWNRVWNLGDGVFMAWRSRLAFRRLPLFGRLNEHSRLVRAHAATTL